MAIRSHFARIALIVLAVLAFAGYFAFSTFVFSPTESDYAADVSTLVPRDVDFFVAKSELRRDFTRLPELALQPRLDATRGWRTWTASPEYGELDRRFGIEQTLVDVKAQIESLGIDPLSAFGGEDLALAGYFKGPTLAQADWALYGRANWLGKLAVALISHPGVIGLEKRGLLADVADDHVALSGGQLPRPIYVTRVRDVVIAGTSKELVLKALDLNARGGQESFGLGANYNDHILQARRTTRGNDLELYADWRTLAEKLQISGRWPDPGSDLISMAFASRLFQLGSIRSLAGAVGFDHGLVVDLHGELSSELMTPVQKSLYRVRGREPAQIVNKLARLARPDSQIVAHLEVDLGDFLNEFYNSLEQATRQLLDDTIRSTGAFSGTPAFIAEIDTLFKGRIGLIMRANDYPTNAEKDPPHNDVPMPALTVVLWTEPSEKAFARIKELQHLVSDNQGRFGIQGRNNGRGVFINTLQPGGFEAWEYWSPFIDGTGHVAVARDADMYFISNSYAMLADVLNRSSPTARVERLSDQPQFTQLVNEGLKQSNLFLWINPRTLAPTLRAFASRDALAEVKGRIDWNTIRAREEDRVLREQFPGKRRGQLDPDTQAQLDQLVEPVIAETEARVLREQVPALAASLERQITYAEMCSAALLMVALDPKSFDLSLSAIVPLDP